MILIFWTLDFQTWRKRKSSSFVDVFFRSLSKDFPLPSLAPLVRFDSRFEAKLQSAKLSSVIREAKVTDPVVKRKGYEGVGGRTFAEIENRTPAMKYTLRLCRFSTLPGDSGSNLSMLSTTSFSLFFFFFLRRSVTKRMITAWKDSPLNLTNFGCFRFKISFTFVHDRCIIEMMKIWYISESPCLKIQKKKEKRFRID